MSRGRYSIEKVNSPPNYMAEESLHPPLPPLVRLQHPFVIVHAKLGTGSLPDTVSRHHDEVRKIPCVFGTRYVLDMVIGASIRSVKGRVYTTGGKEVPPRFMSGWTLPVGGMKRAERRSKVEPKVEEERERRKANKRDDSQVRQPRANEQERERSGVPSASIFLELAAAAVESDWCRQHRQRWRFGRSVG